MKKVNLNRRNEVYVDDITKKDIVGVIANTGRRLHIVKTNPGRYIFVTPGEDNNYISKVFFNSIESALNDDIVREAFVFDTRFHFLKWAIEELETRV